MSRTVVRIVAIFVLAPLLSPATLAGDQPIVISKFCTQGPGGSFDEFVQLYNRTCDPVDVSNWRLRITGANKAAFSSGTTVPPHGHLLLTSPSYTRFPFGDIDYTISINSSGCIALVDSVGAIVDAVGTSAACNIEGDPLNPVSSTSDWAYERKPGGADGHGQDNDDNFTDFRFISPSFPQNSSSPPTPPCVADCIPCDTNCNGTVNQFDIDPFILLVKHLPPPPCSPCAGDTNSNGTINAFDIVPFVDCLIP